ncbi:MAG TPA: hypothetical protein VFJ92_10625 [Gemmatimonadales bacterium]|jgi:hypothetical protein|nr:hypothetical protein [Gemmatimonadales bacterium]
MHARARTVILLALWWLGGTSLAAAQVPEGSRADSLAAVLNRLTARIDSLESGHCPDTTRLALPAPSGNARADSLLAVTAELDRRLRTLRDQRCAGAAPAAPAAPADTTDELAAIRAAAAGAAGGAAAAGGTPADTTAAPPPAPEPQAPRNASALNPEISATGDIRLVARDGHQHDNGVAREFEVGLQSTLDPYSTAKIFLSFENGEVGVEEGYLYWTGLPGKLRVDVGKFRQQLGDLNRWHLHALPETEYPLVYQRFLAPEGLSGVGVSLYTTLPVSLLGGTHEVWVQGTTAESQTLFGDGHQPSLLLRLQNFWQLNRSTYAQIGITGVGGNDDDSDLRSRLGGLDFRLTWRPPEAGTRREVTFRAEGYRLHATEAGTTTDRYGTFLDLSARLSRRWIAAGRYDWVEAPRGPDDTEWRITPSLTWWQSEFVYLRLEGEHRDSELEGTQNLLTLQAVFAMGPHKHETY